MSSSDPQLWDRARRALTDAHGSLVDSFKVLFNGVHDAVTRLNPPPEPTYEQLLNLYRPPTDRPQLGRVEVGAVALKELTDAYTPGAPGPADPLGAVYGTLTLYGVPIVEPSGDEALAPGAWRLLATDGAVIKEGTL